MRAHLAGADDELVVVRPVLERAPRFAELLKPGGEEGYAALRIAEGSGRPVGNADFIAGLEKLLGRPIARRAPGRKPATNPAPQLNLGLGIVSTYSEDWVSGPLGPPSRLSAALRRLVEGPSQGAHQTWRRAYFIQCHRNPAGSP